MKQKLLNSFTWRGTLLVALLSCAFSAWGQQQQTATLTFTANNTPGLNSVDGISWTVTGDPSYGDAYGLYKEGSYTLTSSSLTGTITKIEINSFITKNGKTTASVEVILGGSSVGSTSVSSTSSSNTVSFNGQYYVDAGTIVVNVNHSKGKAIAVKSVKVTYVSKATIPAPGALDNETGVYYGTYSNKCQYVVPPGLKAHPVSAHASGVLAVADFDEGTTIPANTGVMISATTEPGDAYTADLKLATVPALSNNNMLKPTGDNGITEEAMRATGSAFYYLTINPENDQIGFYRRNEDGAAFAMPANKAYLAISSTGVKGYSLNDVVNGIKVVETTETESKAIYNLAGQRVSKMQKGIYVVNGKKVLVK